MDAGGCDAVMVVSCVAAVVVAVVWTQSHRMARMRSSDGRVCGAAAR